MGFGGAAERGGINERAVSIGYHLPTSQKEYLYEATLDIGGILFYGIRTNIQKERMMIDQSNETGHEVQPARSFNPNDHVMQLKSREGAKDYLPVQWVRSVSSKLA